MHITVGICTWNRARHLDRTLEEMLKLRIPAGVSWELLVVNNNSTDDTDAVLAAYEDKLPLRRLFESRQGKSHACNLLVQEATGELLLWTDDDVLVSADWMEQYVAAARRWPEAMFFGGTIDPNYEVSPPSWVLSGLQPPPGPLAGPLAVLQLGDEVRPLEADEFPFGANMAMYTETLRQNPFDGRLGPTGKQLLRGEDTRLVEMLKDQGKLGIWVGSAKVRHWVPRERMTRAYVWEWYYRAGITALGAENLPPCRRIFGIPRWMLRNYLGRIAGWARSWFSNEYERIQAWRKLAYDFGRLIESRRQWRQADAAMKGKAAQATA